MTELPVRLPGGNILIPKRAEIHDLPGGTHGDGIVEISPADPDWAEWDTWIRLYGSESDNPPIDDRPAEAR